MPPLEEPAQTAYDRRDWPATQTNKAKRSCVAVRTKVGLSWLLSFGFDDVCNNNKTDAKVTH